MSSYIVPALPTLRIPPGVGGAAIRTVELKDDLCGRHIPLQAWRSCLQPQPSIQTARCRESALWRDGRAAAAQTRPAATGLARAPRRLCSQSAAALHASGRGSGSVRRVRASSVRSRHCLQAAAAADPALPHRRRAPQPTPPCRSPDSRLRLPLLLRPRGCCQRRACRRAP